MDELSELRDVFKGEAFLERIVFDTRGFRSVNHFQGFVDLTWEGEVVVVVADDLHLKGRPDYYDVEGWADMGTTEARVILKGEDEDRAWALEIYKVIPCEDLAYLKEIFAH